MLPSNPIIKSDDKVPPPVEKTPAKLAYEAGLIKLAVKKQRLVEQETQMQELVEVGAKKQWL